MQILLNFLRPFFYLNKMETVLKFILWPKRGLIFTNPSCASILAQLLLCVPNWVEMDLEVFSPALSRVKDDRFVKKDCSQLRRPQNGYFHSNLKSDFFLLHVSLNFFYTKVYLRKQNCHVRNGPASFSQSPLFGMSLGERVSFPLKCCKSQLHSRSKGQTTKPAHCDHVSPGLGPNVYGLWLFSLMFMVVQSGAAGS